MGPRSAGARAGPGLLRPRRHAADRHRRQRGAGLPQPGRSGRRAAAARRRSRARGDRAPHRRAAGPRRRTRPRDGIHEVANASMARAMRAVTDRARARPARLYADRLRRQRARSTRCDVARELGIRRVLRARRCPASSPRVGMLLATSSTTSSAPARGALERHPRPRPAGAGARARSRGALARSRGEGYPAERVEISCERRPALRGPGPPSCASVPRAALGAARARRRCAAALRPPSTSAPTAIARPTSAVELVERCAWSATRTARAPARLPTRADVGAHGRRSRSAGPSLRHVSAPRRRHAGGRARRHRAASATGAADRRGVRLPRWSSRRARPCPATPSATWSSP